MKCSMLYLNCILLPIITKSGLAETQDIHIHIYGIGKEEVTSDNLELENDDKVTNEMSLDYAEKGQRSTRFFVS